MPSIPEELDVFRRPHFHMKQLVRDIEAELHHTNFTDSVAVHTLLNHLLSKFREFICHEEIENKYIVKELMPRLPTDAKTTLYNDIHSDNRLSDLVNLVDSGLQLEVCRSECQRLAFGEQLKSSIANFTIDFIPHMDEEEEVFLPLLLEYFSESELRQLTLHVLELHQLPEGQLHQEGRSVMVGDQESPAPVKAWSPSLVTLPTEILLHTLSYLSPRDLLRMLPLHSTFYHLTRDGSLWQHIHPVRWARGHWDFFTPPPVDNQELLSNGLIEENSVTKELLSAGTKINANLSGTIYGANIEEAEVRRELCILQGVLEHVLPKVGAHVVTLDLSHGKAVTNEVVFRMLRMCPNLKYLDVSHTVVSDFAFRGLLCKDNHRWQLEHVDISGCSRITDTTLQRLAQALSSRPSPFPTSCSLTMSGHSGGQGPGEEEGGNENSRLKCLILSGCYSITDVGLRSLATVPSLPCLHYLNLSGLPNVTREGLGALVSAAPNLPPDLLFYCDNIMAGPYSDCASGCQNIGSSNLQCCRLDL